MINVGMSGARAVLAAILSNPEADWGELTTIIKDTAYVAEILEAIGVERCGSHGTTATLAVLNDAVKKGGAMACHYVGGAAPLFP
ncbi:DUF711 family protein [Moorellaceae bacterium AZ2]